MCRTGSNSRTDVRCQMSEISGQRSDIRRPAFAKATARQGGESVAAVDSPCANRPGGRGLVPPGHGGTAPPLFLQPTHWSVASFYPNADGFRTMFARGHRKRRQPANGYSRADPHESIVIHSLERRLRPSQWCRWLARYSRIESKQRRDNVFALAAALLAR